MFQGLAAFPNVEVRVFNPFCCARGSIAGKFLASLTDFERLNHRMHNKLFMADGVMAVMGGRNIADEYFLRSATSNFVDMDVFLIGAAVPKLASIFDAYWNSPQAYSMDAVTGPLPDLEVARQAVRSSGGRGRADELDQLAGDRLPRIRTRSAKSWMQDASDWSGAPPSRSPTRRPRSRRRRRRSPDP